MHYYTLTLHLILIAPTKQWWPFSSYEPDVGQNTAAMETNVAVMFAPFEVSEVEHKFLTEAQHYLQNLPMLDQCNLLIINRLKKSCNKLSDEELSKVSVNLLNCQSAVEGRKVYKCTDDMSLSACTSSMDSDTWNSYHIISNRARAICHTVRQAEFRMKTEQTVNNMAQAALENVNMLKGLASGQQKLRTMTDDAVKMASDNHASFIEKQEEFQRKQKRLGDDLNSNMVALAREKRMIVRTHKQVEEYTNMINMQLASLVQEIQKQEATKKEGEKEILKDLDSVKQKADEVLKKMENAFENVDSYQGNIESKQNKTLENLQEIQEAISFMNDVLNKLHSSFDHQIPWLHSLFGGTIDKLTMVTIMLTHMMFFVVALFAVVFINAPSVTRIVMLFIVPLNCISAIQQNRHLDFTHLSCLLAATLPLNYLTCQVLCYVQQKRTGDEVLSVGGKVTPKKALGDLSLDNVCDLPINEANFKSVREMKHSMFHENLLKSMEDSFELSSFLNTSSPMRKRLLKRQLTPPNLDTTAGGSVRCNAYTKSGSRCKNAVLNNETCRMHTPRD